VIIISNKLALIGGEEFSDDFQHVHASFGVSLGEKARVTFLPTAAANDGIETVEHWCSLAREKLSALGLIVDAPRVIDPESANDPRHAQLVADADWVYLGGGYAHVALPILQGTKVMQALLSARERGALISGASAGAMMMGMQAIVITPELLEDVGKYWETGAPPEWDPPVPPLIEGLDWLIHKIIAPHFDRPWFSRRWLDSDLFKTGSALIGIDEYTALVSLDTDGSWEVRGRGFVTIHRTREDFTRYGAGERLTL
jgi:cyanophycinase-like exopeptidase